MSLNGNYYLPGVVVIPSSLTITAITQAFPMVVTVSADSVTQSNSYIVGQLVKLSVPQSYKMYQANGLIGKIVAIGTNTLSLNIDSTGFDPFSVPAITAEQPASLAPAGSMNLQYSNSTNNVPFQNLNNIGN